MTTYHSTRSRNESLTSKQAILEGIAHDGGLFVRDDVAAGAPSLGALMAGTYQDRAKLVLGHLLDDFTAEEITSCVDAAYGDNFDSPAVTPVSPCGDDWTLELWHGPTSAFKDVALQMLPQLMRVSRAGDGRNVMIVTATSGDTGKAALEGFADVPGTGVTVFYPHGKVSDVQRLQMATQRGNNVAVCAIEGNFDDAQTEVKRIFADAALRDRLGEENVVLSSANSINVGRLVPQVTYYFDAYAQLASAGALKVGDAIDFCVPTGNFGDVLAGYYAKLMGLPVRTLVVASNANDVLTDFIATGTYDRRRPFHKTISPSMDILVSSNLERLLFYLSEGDCDLVASLMADLAEKGAYTIPPALLERLHATFACGRSSDEDTRATIRSTWEEHGVLLDPHTAVARHVLEQRPADGTCRVVLSTASPYKFSADVLAALGHDTAGMGGFACMDALEELSHTTAPAALSALRSAPERFGDVVAVDGMNAYVEDKAKELLA
ncbi:threonine synthase [uncultured Parolsenella sp.]|uniref:threonine synthase n=1 Tax=uncultured Parolsenella sp. TaxID=2083008 RepID=UPI0025D803E4|nr:threonine synthase [uncultured Parolsenella sp.]